MQFTELSQPLQNIFTPPDGYQIDRVLLTTYTMSSRILCDLVLNFLQAQNSVRYHGATEIQKRLALESFSDFDRIQVYVQKILPTVSSKKTGGVDQYTEKLAQNMVHPVFVHESFFFHPKLILVKFSSPEKSCLYRLSVSSKNLTYDNYFQAGLVLEGKTQETSSLFGQNLLDFMHSFIPETEFRYWEELENAEFSCSLEGKELKPEFYDSRPGLKGTLLPRLLKDIQENQNAAYRFLSDSVSWNLPDKYNIPKQDLIMVSNVRSWLANFGNRQEKGLLPSYCQVLDGNDPPYIHGKIFAIQTAEKTILYAGSANATVQALENNFEAVLRLEITDPVDLSCLKNYSFAPITWTRLEKVENSPTYILEQYFSNLSISASYSQKDGEVTCSLVHAPALPDFVKSQWFCIPNSSRKIEITAQNPNENLSWEIAFPCTPLQIPKEYANILVNYRDGSASCREIFPVKIHCSDPLQIPSISDEEYGKALYAGLIPTPLDVIPPCGCHPSDSFDIRLGKYLALPDASSEKICENVQTIRKKLKQTDSDSIDFDLLSYEEAIKKVEKQFEWILDVLNKEELS